MRKRNEAAPPVAEMAGPTAPATLRCAIYTRKSTGEGLKQDFNSLDAQREAAEAVPAEQRTRARKAVDAMARPRRAMRAAMPTSPPSRGSPS